jgi:hypothetical protein
MIRRLPSLALGLGATLAILLAACGGTTTGPALTDPKEILTAALKSTESAKSVHLDITVDGKASIALPVGGAAGAPVDLTGTTASADVDFAAKAAHATFSVPALLNFAGELIAVDGKSYLKTTLTGPLYQESAAGQTPIDPTNASGMVDNLGDLLSKPGVVLVKGEDVACGSKQCYTVSADLTAADLGVTGTGAISGLPVDLTGATLKLTVRVEKDLPYHLAGVTAVLTMPNQGTLTMELTASKWDAPVSISAPPADQIKPTS